MACRILWKVLCPLLKARAADKRFEAFSWGYGDYDKAVSLTTQHLHPIYQVQALHLWQKDGQRKSAIMI